MKYISRTVWILSFVSLFTDVASEMLYPIMPIYLKSIGFSIVFIGVLEGIAEATAGLTKGYFGKLSDHIGQRLPFVRIGYLLSAISKPMMALLTWPVWIFTARTIDRLGKGIRTGARDAILSEESTPATKGRVFGFHRSMDTLGAVMGPAFALLFLYYFPGSYKELFLFAFIPGILAITFTFLLKEKARNLKTDVQRVGFFSFFNYWKNSPSEYKRLVGGLLFFTLFNSSDVFLLLKMKQAGLGDTAVIGVYIFYNLVYSIFAFPVGILADKLGLKNTLIFGLGLFALVYLGMSFNENLYVFLGLFFLYGIYAAATEGVSKAWISNVSNKEDTATAIGTYSGFQSICALVASSLAGFIWFNAGASTTFIVTGVAAAIAAYYLKMIKTTNP